MPDGIPETGDVVIHSSGPDATPSYAICAVPGPDQFGCATRKEAERMARSCAKRSGVNLWFSEQSERLHAIGSLPRIRATTPTHAFPRSRSWRGPQSRATGSPTNTLIERAEDHSNASTNFLIPVRLTIRAEKK